MSLENLWRVLDVVLLKRVYCANWQELNDPMEGAYELFFEGPDLDRKTQVYEHLVVNREKYRIASFSASATNFLLWSHYSNGHKGVALELEIDGEDPALREVIYSSFDHVFDETTDTDKNYPDVFVGKTEPWKYEKEWRIVTTDQYYSLDQPCKRILLGASIPPERKDIIHAIAPADIQIVQTRIERYLGDELPCVIPIHHGK